MLQVTLFHYTPEIGRMLKYKMQQNANVWHIELLQG